MSLKQSTKPMVRKTMVVQTIRRRKTESVKYAEQLCSHPTAGQIIVVIACVTLTSCGVIPTISGVCHTTLGQHKQAIDDFTKQIGMAPDRSEFASYYFF